MIRFLIIPIILSLASLLLWGIWRTFLSSMKKTGGDKKDAGQLKGSAMVLDTICQTYLPKERALSEKVEKEIYYFCSQSCRKQFHEQQAQQKEKM